MIRRVVIIAIVIAAAMSAGAPAMAGHDARSAPRAAAHAATIHTFAGKWYGHTRSLTIHRKGHAVESIGDGCCDQIITLRFVISHVRGTTHHASARAKVTHVTVQDPSAFSSTNPAPQVGEVKRIRLRHGVIHETITGTIYCDYKRDLGGTCGA